MYVLKTYLLQLPSILNALNEAYNWFAIQICVHFFYCARLSNDCQAIVLRNEVEYPFRVIKRQFGFVKMRYRGLKKNTAQLFTLFALFALSKLWMVRSKLMEVGA